MSQNITQTVEVQVVNIQNENSCCCWTEAFLCLCFFIGLYRVAKFLKTVFGSFFRKRMDLYKRYGGGWALVTGGSEGIGEAIASQLAASGFNLILVSRSSDKLSKAKANINKRCPNIAIQTHSVDFSTLTTQEQYKQTFKNIFDKDISILVNNVGFYNLQHFSRSEFSAIRTQAKVNLLPIAILTRIFLEKATKRNQRSGLINLSSVAGIVTYKGAAHYSASKTYDDFFSQAIHYEHKDKIDVLTVRPGYVSSAMTRNTSSFMHATPEQTGKEAVDCLGNTEFCYGPLIHRLMGGFLGLVHPKIATWRSGEEMIAFRREFDKVQ